MPCASFIFIHRQTGRPKKKGIVTKKRSMVKYLLDTYKISKTTHKPDLDAQKREIQN